MQTKIDLCAEALLKIGEPAITSFNGPSAASQIAAKLYDQTIDRLLCMHTWRFATKRYVLPRANDDGFIIPRNILRVISCSAPRHEIIGNKIMASAPSVEISGIARVEPNEFPAYFSHAAVTKLSMAFCIPLTGNQNTFALLNALFENELRTARFIDSASSNAQQIDNFSLISTRF